MTLLDRYLGGRLVGALVRAVLALVALYVVVDLLATRRADILRYDVEWGVVLGYYAAAAPGIFGQIAPWAMLVAGLMVLGDAAQHNEVTAALAGGVSMARLALPAVVVALGLSLLVLVQGLTWGPRSVALAEAMEREDLSRAELPDREPVSFANLAGGWTAHITKFNRLALTGEGVLIHSVRDDAVEQIIAGRIFWDPDRGAWMLEDGDWLVFAGDAATLREQRRITLMEAPIEETPDELFAQERPPETHTPGALAEVIEQAAARDVPVRRMRVAWHAKFSEPAQSFVMIWLAIPFALRLGRGGVAISFGASIVVGVVYLLVYWVVLALGNAGWMPPVVAAWAANALFFVAGLALFRRTPT